ncbi:hypothetical protein LUZ61_015885 [Rhynchospora tenuis]|uniref:Small auxin up regulated protein n=1 Tax=Rhynchospora tenuis TaxID=198213 RepID=A0AAD5Z4H0_9POAL|nr:hypothetical protein LUZ61_015885 [Rhynchospora tenuis]
MLKKEKVPKGYVPILIGKEKEKERVLVHTKLLKHPCFLVLLELAVQEFGYDQKGILQIPCEVEQFMLVSAALKKGNS